MPPFNQNGTLSQHERNIIDGILLLAATNLTFESLADHVSAVERRPYATALVREHCKVLVRKEALFRWQKGNFSTVKVAPSFMPKPKAATPASNPTS